MEFDEKTHKVKIETMTHEEKEAYIKFLTFNERFRHLHERDKCRAMIQLWHSAELRHEEDIKEIDDRVAEVMNGLCV